MNTEVEQQGFFRRESPISGVVVSILVVVLLLLILLCLFLVRSALVLLNTRQMTGAVTTMLNDSSFREKVAETIVVIAPENTVTAQDIETVMEREEVAQAIGQLGSDWFSKVLETDPEAAVDPVDAVLEVLKDPDQQDVFGDALEEAMKELDCTNEDLYQASLSLSEEMGFEPPPAGSDSMAIVTTVLDGSREKIHGETSEVIQVVNTARNELGSITSLLIPLRTLSQTVVFTLINLVLLLFLYGLLLLLLRSLWKPCLYLSIPYLLTGFVLCCIKFIDLGFLIREFDLPDLAGSALPVLQDSLFSTGLIGVIFGILLPIVAIAFKLKTNSSYNKEETKVCSVPNAEVL